ncbi:hypothetical protein AS594_35395 [Streptomyces agglomeratus]|uniref:Uncharacterized protein n=1 Tax=Streptomyces agglomeratus TaxID=285458 RepID=A0A1E5PHE1_9ACTN|nr:hypothetical protein AS594_35395 [Streptomyces agglomeratus]
MAGGVVGHKVGDGRTDRPAADVVLVGQAGDGLAAHRYAARTASAFSSLAAGRRPLLLPFASAARSPS